MPVPVADRLVRAVVPPMAPPKVRAPPVLAVGDLHVENFGTWRDAEGRLTHSNCPDPLPPYNNVGFQILKPGLLAGRAEAAFSIVPIWKQLSAEGRLYGAVMDGFDMHMSDPAAVIAAQARLDGRA